MRAWTAPLILSAGFVIGLAVPTSSGCSTVCTLQGCGGGLEWELTRAEDASFEPGDYAFTTTFEEEAYTFHCTVGATMDTSMCSEAEPVDGAGTWDFIPLLLSASRGNDPGDAPALVLLSVADNTGGNVRGPETATIRIERDGTAIFEDSTTITYERDEDFWGDPECGFCDSREERLAQLP